MRPLTWPSLAEVPSGTLITPDVLRHDGMLRQLQDEVASGEDPGQRRRAQGRDDPCPRLHALRAGEAPQAAGSTAQRISWPDGQPIDEVAEAKEVAAAEAEAEEKAAVRVAKAEAKAEASQGKPAKATAAEGSAEADAPAEAETPAEAEAPADATEASEAAEAVAAPETEDAAEATEPAGDESES